MAAAVGLSLAFVAPAGANTFKVNTRADHKPKACNSSDCTLREAVRAANSRNGKDKVVLPSSKKPYKLKRKGDGEDNAKKGDLDVGSDPLLITGSKAKRAVIQQTVEDRVIDVPDPTNGFVTLRKVTVTGGDETANLAGGGILTDGKLKLLKAVIRGNSSSGGGGGLSTVGFGGSGSQVIAKDTTIANNVSGSAGGGAQLTGLSFDSRFDGVTISGNEAGRGGGIWTNTDDGAIDIVNSTITGNEALTPDLMTAPATGGGISVIDFLADDVGPPVRIEFTTIAGNASLAGRAANVNSGYPIQLQNTIVEDPVTGANCQGDQDSVGYNLDQGTSCDLDQGTDVENADAKLLPLAKDGGPTKTRPLGFDSDAFAEGDCTPSLTFPGIDIGVDQRNEPRPFPAASACDIGAWEGTFEL